MSEETETGDVYDILRNLSFGSLKAEFIRYPLEFIEPVKTSRGSMSDRISWFLKVYEVGYPEFHGIGECAPLPGLSIESQEMIEDSLLDICLDINSWEKLISGGLDEVPSVQFALEQALLDLRNQGNKILFPSKFTEGNEVIRINGLIWMGGPQYMIDQINQKLEQGFRCLKMKIGALDFDQELDILREVREIYSVDELELRLDANGAFSPDEALEKLEELSEFYIHSIEQPIQKGQLEFMAELAELGSIPIALDEELIGIISRDEKEELLDAIMPSYIILKPSLLGGFRQAEEWIEIADQRGIGWWVTSALESNVGLNAIAQWTFTKQNPMYQGLGTGKLFRNNIESPLYTEGELLMVNPQGKWRIIW